VAAPTFYYDFSSPYAYLAAHRVDDVLPVRPDWRPISFGFLLRAIGRVPWSLGPEREAGMRECEARARAAGLPPISWPDGWPAESYSLLVLRAAVVAEEAGRLREFSLAAYAKHFVEAADLREMDVVLDAATRAGVEAEAVRAGVERPEVKGRLRETTDAAVAAGVTGIPTVSVDGRLFWGDDRLEDAAAALR
jgi:2-hydroxychromene-2-carboxylate isomerase